MCVNYFWLSSLSNFESKFVDVNCLGNLNKFDALRSILDDGALRLQVFILFMFNLFCYKCLEIMWGLSLFYMDFCDSMFRYQIRIIADYFIENSFFLSMLQIKMLEYREKRLQMDPLKFSNANPSTEELDSLEFRKVVCKGVFDDKKSIFVGPRSRSISGVTENGYYVITPLIPVHNYPDR